MGALQVIIGFLLIFIIPGYLISWTFFKKLDFFDRSSISVGLSICFNIFIGLVLGYIGLLNIFWYYLIISVFVLVSLILIRKEIIGYLKKDLYFFKDKKNLFQLLLVLIALVFIFVLIFLVHIDYSGMIQNPHLDTPYVYEENFEFKYPIHTDEYTHLARSIKLIEEERIDLHNPYRKDLSYHKDLELGFHVFSSGFFILTGLDPVLDLKYLAALFAIINSLMLFVLGRYITKRFYIGLLSILFFAVLKSNINLMGNWFFIPSTMSVFLIFLFFYLFLRLFKKFRADILLLALVVLLISIFVYPPSAVIIILTSFVYLIFNHKRFSKKLKRLFLILALVGLIIFVLNFNFFINSIKFGYWTATAIGDVRYNLLSLYGVLGILLSILGFIFIFLKKYSKLLFILPAIFLVNIIIYTFTDSTYLIPYTRNVYYFLTSLVPLTSIGLYHLLVYLKKLVKNKYIFSLLVLVIVVGLTLFSLRNYYDINEQKNISNVDSKNLVILYLLEKQDYEALKFLKDNYGKNNLILVDPLVSVGVYPIGRGKAKSMISSNIGLDGDPRMYFKFLDMDCKDRTFLIQEENFGFALSRFPLNCPGFLKVYDKQNYVYDVRSLNG
ncbi:MAG: hypothetical protein AABW46_02280 [Nanoarchaeota archaeon]